MFLWRVWAGRPRMSPPVLSLAAFPSGVDGKPPTFTASFLRGGCRLCDLVYTGCLRFHRYFDQNVFTELQLFALVWCFHPRFCMWNGTKHVVAKLCLRVLRSCEWGIFFIRRLALASVSYCTAKFVLCLEQLLNSLHPLWMVNNSLGPSLWYAFHLKIEMGYWSSFFFLLLLLLDSKLKNELLICDSRNRGGFSHVSVEPGSPFHQGSVT